MNSDLPPATPPLGDTPASKEGRVRKVAIDTLQSYPNLPVEEPVEEREQKSRIGMPSLLAGKRASLDVPAPGILRSTQGRARSIRLDSRGSSFGISSSENDPLPDLPISVFRPRIGQRDPQVNRQNASRDMVISSRTNPKSHPELYLLEPVTRASLQREEMLHRWVSQTVFCLSADEKSERANESCF